MQSQLNQWKAEIDKLKAKASGANAEAQLEMNKQIKALESKIEESKAKLSALAEATEKAWQSMKGGVETAWSSLKSAAGDAADKFKDK